MNNTSRKLPIPVQRALKVLGHDIRNARLRRRIQAGVMAERVSIVRTTLYKVEKGDPGVSMGVFASVLYVLGMLDRLAEIAALSTDAVGMSLEDETLPKRIRHSGVSPSKNGKPL